MAEPTSTYVVRFQSYQAEGYQWAVIRAFNRADALHRFAASEEGKAAHMIEAAWASDHTHPQEEESTWAVIRAFNRADATKESDRG